MFPMQGLPRSRFQSSIKFSENEIEENDAITISKEVSRGAKTSRRWAKGLQNRFCDPILSDYTGQTIVHFKDALPISRSTFPVRYRTLSMREGFSAYVVVPHEVFSEPIDSVIDCFGEDGLRVAVQISKEASSEIQSRGIGKQIRQIAKMAQNSYKSVSRIDVDYYRDPEMPEWQKLRFSFTVSGEPGKILSDEKHFKTLLRKAINDDIRELFTLSYNFE
jgi:hypothetical protein